jgi:rod shape determining protein RodA
LSKVLVILVLAGWLEKNLREIQQVRGLIQPFMIVLAHIALILMQPDFGSTLVYFPILLTVLFVAGAQMLFLSALLIYGGLASVLILTHTVLSLSPTFLEAHSIWNFFFRGLTLGKEFVILQIIVGLGFAAVGWLLKQLRFRIPWTVYLVTFMLVLASFLSSAVFVHALKDYQRKRLVVFFNPKIDPMGSGYHVIQSMVALGSGKIFGKGLFSGTQGRLGFLPEQHTDFIFSVLGEELGFALSGLVLLLYLLLVWRAVAIAGEARDMFGSLVAIGIGSMFAFYAILNLAMVMGLAPVTGLPLPFLSYGGSALFSSLAATGLLLSIHLRRYVY